MLQLMLTILLTQHNF